VPTSPRKDPHQTRSQSKGSARKRSTRYTRQTFDSREPFSGTLRVLSVPRPKEHLNRGRYELQYEFMAAVLQPSMRGGIQVRLIRERSVEALRRVLPGSTIRFDGYFSTKYGGRELHILRGEIVHRAQLIDGYQPRDRPDGTWRWFGLPASGEQDERPLSKAVSASEALCGLNPLRIGTEFGSPEPQRLWY